MTGPDAGRDAAVDQEPPQRDEDDGVPNGEEQIDELGRNPTQQRIDDELTAS